MQAVFIERPPSQETKLDKGKTAFKERRFGHIIRGCIKLMTRRTPVWANDSHYRGFAPVYFVDNFNGNDCENLLEKLKPDLIILGGARIIKKNILKIPSIGTLNGHPGWLPDYRGMDVIPWAILTNGILGVTIHFVDTGIDTGLILKRELLVINYGDTLDTLAVKAEDLIGKTMATAVRELADGKSIFTPNCNGKYYHKMSDQEKDKARDKLKELQDVRTCFAQ